MRLIVEARNFCEVDIDESPAAKEESNTSAFLSDPVTVSADLPAVIFRYLGFPLVVSEFLGRKALRRPPCTGVFTSQAQVNPSPP